MSSKKKLRIKGNIDDVLSKHNLSSKAFNNKKSKTNSEPQVIEVIKTNNKEDKPILEFKREKPIVQDKKLKTKPEPEPEPEPKSKPKPESDTTVIKPEISVTKPKPQVITSKPSVTKPKLESVLVTPKPESTVVKSNQTQKLHSNKLSPKI